jgi:virginiamycin B lyase
MRRALLLTLLLATAAWPAAAEVTTRSFPVPEGARPHDVAPGPDGVVWYTAQAQGALGRLDPATGQVEQIPLGDDSAPHGVIVGPDGAPWITDGGLNAIVRVDPVTRQVRVFPLPKERAYANLNTATFDGDGLLWFTGQNGIYGRLDPRTGAVTVHDAPHGRGPYGIATTPDGDVYFASLAGSYVGHIDRKTGEVKVLTPPHDDQGARRVWSDSRGGIWVSEWNAGHVSRYDPDTGSWQSWRLPGDSPQPYAVYVDERDMVWLSDFGSNAMVRFDPDTEQFEVMPSEREDAQIRQILGRAGEVWAPESGTDTLVVYLTEDAADRWSSRAP